MSATEQVQVNSNSASSAEVVQVNEVTVKMFSEKHKMDYLSASAFLKGLTELGVVKLVRQQKSENGKGKPSNVYAVPTSITLNDL